MTHPFLPSSLPLLLFPPSLPLLLFPGANAIVMAYRRALMINDQHKLTEMATHMVTKTLDVAQAVHSTVKQVKTTDLRPLTPQTFVPF